MSSSTHSETSLENYTKYVKFYKTRQKKTIYIESLKKKTIIIESVSMVGLVYGLKVSYSQKK